ncbi:hypothetical protein C7M56_14950 [Clostridium botulinum]|uniref:Uncharacterized protein n=1 Tax=Clostridium botulinum TaxID=1491 RepID=A0ABC8CWX4_CLOBO|nr:hypothetical protein [Clostridium botulinum]AVQ39911.1 hypothetical protein C7M56_14950 [Clostridium botulinum]
MNEESRRYCQEPKEDKLESNAAAFAYNKNYNILVAPNTVNDDDGAVRDANKAKNHFDELMENLRDNDKDMETKSKTTGQATIVNTNLNFIVTI